MTGRRPILATLFAVAMAAPASAQTTPAGAALFDSHCATCHAGSDPRVPTVASLRQRSPEAIVDALENGSMRPQGSALAPAERRVVAEFLAGRAIAAADPPISGGRCSTVAPFNPSQGPTWTGWGPDPTNARFQPAAQAGLTAETVPKLTLKWAFGFPGDSSARGHPTVAGGRLFVGSAEGTVYALDAKTGCTIWSFKAKAGVRAAIAIAIGSANNGAGSVLYFGDGRANAYALNAGSGELLWTRNIDSHPTARVTGTPAVYENRVYFSISSGEEGQGRNANYECCTFRGSLVALNAANGAPVWKTYTIPEEPRSIGRNKGGAVRWGPAGAGIWASPTVDPKRRLVYAATGNMYTEPQQGTSDAVLAFEMDSGKVAWVSQVTPKDVFVVGCNAPAGANCPEEEVGPDFDFGNAPMLASLPDGRSAVIIGQKSGVGWALDPDRRGEVIWQYRAGKGSALGGMEFGSAMDAERVYFPVADGNMPTAGELHAVRIDTGERVWQAMPQPVKCGERGRGCTPAILAAITVTPGAVFAGALDGGLRIYSTTDGRILWEFDTNREFTTVNGVAAKGASINGPGPIVAGGMLYVNSGYGALGGRPGNVLLAFGPE